MHRKNRIARRHFVGLLAGLPFLSEVRSQSISRRKEGSMLLLVGTYTSGESKSKGIYVLQFDPRNGRMTSHGVVEGVEEPSFLAIDQGKNFVYAVNETLEFNGRKSGSVSSFTLRPDSGSLTFINKQASMGAAPCHITVSRDGRFVLVANYLGGNVAVLPVSKDGVLSPAVDVEQHLGSGPDKKRQDSAHAHSVILDQKGRFATAHRLLPPSRANGAPDGIDAGTDAPGQ